MPTSSPSVGQELLDIPFPDMVLNLAMGIATAQQALDENSIATAVALADTKIDLVMAVVQTIAADGSVSFVNADPVNISLLQIGLMPTFYQFIETTIQVTMDIKTTTSTELKVDFKGSVSYKSKTVSASVSLDVSFNRKFGKEVHGTSSLATKLIPVPPPAKLAPTLTVVDNRVAPTP